MKLALDWDGTGNQDIGLWMIFVMAAQKRGHEVHIVTMRYPSEAIIGQTGIPEDFALMVDGVHFTSRKAKRTFMEQKGIKIDVWIDDHPMAVEKDAKDIWEAVTPEGHIHDHGETRKTFTAAEVTEDIRKFEGWEDFMVDTIYPFTSLYSDHYQKSLKELGSHTVSSKLIRLDAYYAKACPDFQTELRKSAIVDLKHGGQHSDCVDC